MPANSFFLPLSARSVSAVSRIISCSSASSSAVPQVGSLAQFFSHGFLQSRNYVKSVLFTKKVCGRCFIGPWNPEALREPLICPPGQYHDALQKEERIKLRQWPYLLCHEPPPELHQPFSDVSPGSFRCLWLDWRSGVLRKKWKDGDDLKICFQFNLVCAVSLDLVMKMSCPVQ